MYGTGMLMYKKPFERNVRWNYRLSIQTHRNKVKVYTTLKRGCPGM